MKCRLIAALCIYNEEDYIITALDQLKKIKDLDAIEILDGSWAHGGSSAKSTDATKQKVAEWQAANPYANLEYREVDHIFESEPAKRNCQLKIIDDYYGYEPYWVLVFDADEKIRFWNGYVEIYLKDNLMEGAIGIFDVYAIGSEKKMYSPRLFEGGQGIHYDTSRSMVVHDQNCDVIMDYNLANQYECQHGEIHCCQFAVDYAFLVNYWPWRQHKRLEQKEEFCAHQESGPYHEGPCKKLI